MAEGGATTGGGGASNGSGGTRTGSAGAGNGYGGTPAGAGGASNGYGGASNDHGGATSADAGDGCVPETLTTPPGVPPALVPTGATLVHFLHARGTQTYQCLQNPVVGDAGPPTYDWGGSAHAATPEALVYDDCGVAKIHHFAGPTWEWIADGSSIRGTKVAGVAQAGTIPWLLLKTTPVTPGLLSDATYVQRLETNGGAPPADGCDAAHAGDKVSVDYTAGYYFYTGPDVADGG